MSYTNLNIDFNPFINKIQGLKITEIDKFDELLSDTANYVCDTIDIISDAIPTIDQADHQAAISDLKGIQTQITNLFELLYTINGSYDSHYMDRLLSILASLEEDTTSALEVLNS